MGLGGMDVVNRRENEVLFPGLRLENRAALSTEGPFGEVEPA